MAAYLLYLGLILVATTTIQSQNILSSLSDLKKGLGKIAPFVPVRHLEDEVAPIDPDAPFFELYYESMCPGCRKFYTTYLYELVSTLGPHMNFGTFAYGKAATIIYYNASVDFWCQHGEAECYGNKLHACSALLDPDDTRNYLPLQFKSCLMEFERSGNGSDDAAVDECGSKINLNVTLTNSIKECAKGDQGTEALALVGWFSVQANYTSLPHILINGKHWTGKYEDLMKDVCATFVNPPEACKDVK